MAVRSKKPALVAIEAPPKPAAIPEDDRARFPANEYVFVAGRRTFMLAFAASKTSLGWLDAGALQTLDIPRYQGIGIHPDGTRALFAANRTVCEVVLATGVVTKLIDLGGGWDACGCGYGPGETAVVATGDRVVLLRREGDTLVELQQLPVHGSGLSVYRDGTLAVCTSYSTRSSRSRSPTRRSPSARCSAARPPRAMPSTIGSSSPTTRRRSSS